MILLLAADSGGRHFQRSAPSREGVEFDCAPRQLDPSVVGRIGLVTLPVNGT
ncbi:hypothetical protein [Mycobacterium colombiense]|uniref:hypothetical protein n=1 Tax=Mycobacterium colombiense TaxID=339268 RepID=UPI0004AD7B58|nr:hypothetical protein [Mycobacterium colombiense]